MVRLADEDIDNNRRWEAEQLAREQRSLRYEKERDDRATMKEEKEASKNEPSERFQYMAITRASSEEMSPEINEAAEEAERELDWMDQQELLRIGHPDNTTNINSVTVQPAWQASTMPPVVARAMADDPPLTRSST